MKSENVEYLKASSHEKMAAWEVNSDKKVSRSIDPRDMPTSHVKLTRRVEPAFGPNGSAWKATRAAGKFWQGRRA